MYFLFHYGKPFIFSVPTRCCFGTRIDMGLVDIEPGMSLTADHRDGAS
jgi:hypothetical protein